MSDQESSGEVNEECEEPLGSQEEAGREIEPEGPASPPTEEDKAKAAKEEENEAALEAARAKGQEMLEMIARNDKASVEAALNEPRAHELLKVVLHREGVACQMLMHAIFMHKKKITLVLFEASERCIRREALFFCVRYCKYDVALLLLAQCGVDINHQRASDGNSLLHCVCSRPKPPVAFVAELCKLKVLRVNCVNFAGFTPVHLLALHSTGVEGRDVCQLLKARGALLDKLTPGGKTALQITRNSFLREILSFGVSNRRRQNPLSLIPKREQEELDKVPFEKLPKIKDPEVGVLGRALSTEERDAARPRKKILPEEEGELVNRLYNVARQKQEEGMKALSKRVLGDDAKKLKMSPEEQDMSVDRLFGSYQEQADKLKDLVTKYVEPAGDPKQLNPEDLQESIQRLYTVSIEKSKEKKSYLLSKYLPATLVSDKCGSKRLKSSDAVEVSKRLHDSAITKQKETMDKLKGQYLQNTKSNKVMTQDEWKAMGERLTARP